MGIWIEEEDGLLWVGVRQGASPPTHLDYPSPTNQITAPWTYTLHANTYHPLHYIRSTLSTALSLPSFFLRAAMPFEERILLFG